MSYISCRSITVENNHLKSDMTRFSTNKTAVRGGFFCHFVHWLLKTDQDLSFWDWSYVGALSASKMGNTNDPRGRWGEKSPSKSFSSKETNSWGYLGVNFRSNNLLVLLIFTQMGRLTEKRPSYLGNWCNRLCRWWHCVPDCWVQAIAVLRVSSTRTWSLVFA